MQFIDEPARVIPQQFRHGRTQAFRNTQQQRAVKSVIGAGTRVTLVAEVIPER